MKLPAVELVDARKTFPGSPPVEALGATSLVVHEGESVAIVGPSGSGKSTLLSLMGTLDHPTAGDVLIEGYSTGKMRDWKRTALRSERIGFVFQQFHLLAQLSAIENVSTGLLYSGVRHRERRQRSIEALEMVGLGGRVNHRPGQMSGGEQQRVAIARALVRRPAVLFADEPTGALDSRTSGDVLQLLLRTVEMGTALVVVTHDMQVASHFDRRLHVLDGHVTEGVAA